MQSQWKTVWKFFKDLIGRPYDPAFQIWVFIKEYKNTNLKRYVCASQLCLTLCDPIGYTRPGSSVHRILQARILEWVAIPFSRGSSQLWDRTCVSCVS